MSLPRYPAYKDSGVAWLGEVPGHWAVKKLKQSCHVFPSNVDKKSHEDETPTLLCNYTDVYYNETITKNMNFMAATASADQIAKFTLCAGDTIITKDSETADDIAIAAYVPENLPGIVCGYHLSMVRPLPGTHGAFVKRLFDSTYAKSCFAVRANGLTRVGLGQYELDNVELPFPPLPEQTQIAAFLDRETAKIDELVAEQRRLMALLKEKRQAVISHAVTRGLNPHAPLKPSGIEWLGDVPEHWVQSRLKYNVSGLIDTEHKTAPFFDDGEFLVVRTTNIKDGKLLLDGGKYTNLDGFEEWTQRAIPKPGDIMFTREAPAGEACLVPENIQLCMGQRTVLMQIKHAVLDSNFALWSLYGGLASEFVSVLSQGSTVVHFNMSDIRNIPIMLPPLREQVEIAEFLASELAKLDTLTTEAQRAIDLLQERRTALISAAVTGQIDVRGAVVA